MKKVGIIGAGFAGVSAAQVIAEKGVRVTLFSKEKVPPYYRPRLPEMAFGYEEIDDIFMNKLEWYAENGIELRLDAEVESFNSDFDVILEDGSKEKFDALIISTGAEPVVPEFCLNSTFPNLFQLWSYSDALKIREHLKSKERLVIVGGGVIGIESALRAEDNNLKVIIVEKSPHLMSQNFGKKASQIIEQQLRDHNIDMILDDSVSYLEEKKDNQVFVNTKNQDGVICDVVVVSIGAKFDTSMAQKAGLKTDRKILVNEFLETSCPGIFAAGDIAQSSLVTPCSAKEALAQGKIAGANVLAHFNGEDMKKHEAEPVPLRLKYKDFQIYSVGKVPEVDSEEKILDYDDMKIYRGCIYEGSALAGVQMVGSNKDFMKYQKEFFLSKVWKKLKKSIW